LILQKKLLKKLPKKLRLTLPKKNEIIWDIIESDVPLLKKEIAENAESL